MDDSEDIEEEQREETPMDSSDPPAAPPAPPPHVHDADPRHYWGRGNVMEGEGQVDEGIVLVFAQLFWSFIYRLVRTVDISNNRCIPKY